MLMRNIYLIGKDKIHSPYNDEKANYDSSETVSEDFRSRNQLSRGRTLKI